MNAPPQEAPGAARRAVLMFLLTLASVYLVFGFQWAGGNPLSDPEVAGQSAKFSLTLMAILLAHEMGHYLVARRHGFQLSLPYFLPFPFAFGTLGAVIRLKSLPRSRTALLEMGAAGPLAGFVLAALAIAVGLRGTEDPGALQLQLDPTAAATAAAADAAASAWDAWPLSWLGAAWDLVVGALNLLLLGLERVLEATGAIPSLEPDQIPVQILANPPLMDLLGEVILGAPPGRYANLDPFAFAGWVGCLLTAINLVPIGQLDGGHIVNALWPRGARVISRVGVFALLVAGLFSPGWAVWGILLLFLRAWISLPVPREPGLSPRARAVAVLTLAAFLLSFMPRPVEMEAVRVEDIRWVDKEGNPLPPPVLGGEASGSTGSTP